MIFFILFDLIFFFCWLVGSRIISINIVHHPFKKNTLCLLLRKKRFVFLFFICLLFVLYLFTFCACCLFVPLLSRKKKTFYASSFICFMNFCAAWIYLFIFVHVVVVLYFHGLEYNIFPFSIVQCSCWCDFIYGVNYFI